MERKSPLELLATNPIDLSLLSIKAKLMMIIKKIIEDNKWKQAQAAVELKVKQPRVSNLLNGKISYFSIDMLLEMLGRLGYLLDVTFDPDDPSEPIKMAIKKTAV